MEKVKFINVLDGINKSWSTVEKAKYLYDQICKLSKYDERFIYSNNLTLLNSIYYKKVDINDEIEPTLICKTLNSLYSQLLNKLGISNIIIEKPSSLKSGFKDVALIFYDEKGNKYFTGIAGDLQRSKYGMKTQYFGGIDSKYLREDIENITILKSDELRAVDEKTGYLKKDYSDEVFKLISEEVKQNNEFKKNLSNTPDLIRAYLSQSGIENANILSDEELKSKISEFSMDDILKIKMMIINLLKHHESNYGYIESKKHSITQFQSVFNKSEKKRFDAFDMIKDDGETFKIVSIIRIKLSSDYIYYVYSTDSHEYELVPVEEAIAISKEYSSRKNKLIPNEFLDAGENELDEH